MADLLQNYNISEIGIFLVTLAFAIRGVVSFWDWSVERLRKIFNKENDQATQINSVHDRLARGNRNFEVLFKNQKNFEEKLSELTNKINLLIESDKEDIKSYITEKHHYFCYEKGSIDDYSLDCLEKRFKHYTEEKGNSFVEDLMEEVRTLKKKNN